MNLTDEEIRIKVAESMGWRDLQKTWEGYHEWMHPDGRVRYGTKTCKVVCLPNYPESLDACAQFEATLLGGEWIKYESELRRVVAQDDKDEFWTPHRTIGSAWWCATPRQRCRAYLKTKGIIQ